MCGGNKNEESKTLEGGNKKADLLAKQGSCKEFVRPEYIWELRVHSSTAVVLEWQRRQHHRRGERTRRQQDGAQIAYN